MRPSLVEPRARSRRLAGQPPRRFELAGYRGLVAGGIEVPKLEEQVRRLIDPEAALRSLHWGRNYLYLARLELAEGPLEVVVKQFRHDTLKARLRRRSRGSKAERSWGVARAMIEANLPTPEPILLVDSRRLDGFSFYVCRFVRDALEGRYLIRAMNAGRESELYAEIDIEEFLRTLGGWLRRLHDAGFWHRDLTSGNILLDRAAAAPGELPAVLFIDLNRTRMVGRVSRNRRLRDLSRLPILRPEHQRLLLDAYGGDERREWLRPLRYVIYHHLFLLKNRSKHSVRGGLRRVGDLLLPRRRPHVHIPPPAAGRSVRDRVVWDRLSDQPHQHAGRLEKLRARAEDAGSHLRGLATVLAVAPAARRRYHELRRALYTSPVPWQGVGLALGLREEGDDLEATLAAVEGLGVRRLLLRLHPWRQDHGRARRLAGSLSERGCELVFALPQNRELVRDPGRWCSSVAAIAEQFTPYGRHFQIGHAPNRSKWGVWRTSEYAELFVAAAEVLRRARSDVELLGPAVIDFEPHATAQLLNYRRHGLRFDIVSSLLYVDRRGAPENRQLGLDTVGKVTLIEALVETGRNARGGRSWITEVNWPLWEGPHSPAGRDVAVSEEAQADFLVRYYLLALGTGLVERVYWWQLAAKGYGLVDPVAPGEWRRRPSFAALAQHRSALEGASFLGPLAAEPGVHLYRFRRREQGEVVVAWTSSGRQVEIELPRPASRGRDRDGRLLFEAERRAVRLGGSPAYLELVEE